MRLLRRVLTIGVYRPLLAIWLRGFVVAGREHIPSGPVIFAVAHTSMADTPLLLIALGGRGNRLIVTAARDYFFRRSRPLFGVLVGVAFAAVPFDRVGFARRSLRAAEEWLRHDFSLLVYPHGTIPDIGGDRARLHRGVAALARATGCPVVPVRLAGAAAFLPPGVHWPRRAAVAVRFSPPMYWENTDTLRTFMARLPKTRANAVT